MWWCMTTIAIVGYEDMSPTTIIGRIIASITMLFGLVLFGLLMNVIGKSMITFLFGSTDLNKMNEKEIRAKLKSK